MSQVDKIEAQFAGSRATPEDYPLNVVRSEAFGHALKSLQTRFKNERLFHDSYRSLYIKDLYDDKDGMVHNSLGRRWLTVRFVCCSI